MYKINIYIYIYKQSYHQIYCLSSISVTCINAAKSNLGKDFSDFHFQVTLP